MTAKRRPKFDQQVDGRRVRVYATRTEYEVVFDDTDVSDPESEVFYYPKVGLASVWAYQAIAEFGHDGQR